LCPPASNTGRKQRLNPHYTTNHLRYSGPAEQILSDDIENNLEQDNDAPISHSNSLQASPMTGVKPIKAMPTRPIMMDV
jgi:hypothetical protein